MDTEITLHSISFGFNVECCLVNLSILYSTGLDRIDNARNGNACRTKGGNREILQTFHCDPFPMTWIYHGIECV